MADSILDKTKEWLSNIDWSRYKTDPKVQQMVGAGAGGTAALLALLLSKRGNKIRNALLFGLPTYALGAFGPKMLEYGGHVKDEIARGYRKAKEDRLYRQGKGYRRYAEALNSARNMPDDNLIRKGVARLMGKPTKTELLDRLNKMDPDSFDVQRYNPIRGELEENPINWDKFNVIDGRPGGYFTLDRIRKNWPDMGKNIDPNDKQTIAEW